VPAGVHVQVATLMWQESLGGWMPATYSASYCYDVLSEWHACRMVEEVLSLLRRMRFLHLGVSVVLAQQVARPGSLVRSQLRLAGVPAGGRKPIFPASFHGPSMWWVLRWGVKTSVVCSTCRPGGRLHGGAECPKRWGKKGIALPGFKLDGTYDSQWNNSAPVRAGVANAPSLVDFERRLPAAPPKP
jgi:hypothetical protein